MSGLLRLASCSAFSPARAAFGGGPAARSAPGTPSVALVLSGGLHVAALAVFLIAAARSGSDEPTGREIRISFDPPGIVLTPLIPTVRVDPAPPPARGDGRITPVERVDRDLRKSLEDVLRGVGTTKGILPDRPVSPSGHGDGDLPPTAKVASVATDEVSNYDEAPFPVYAPEPEYPSMPLEAGIEGKVVLEALVGRDGLVRQVVVKEGNPMLAESASKAVKLWRFKPGLWRGRAVTTWVAIPVVFRIY